MHRFRVLCATALRRANQKHTGDIDSATAQLGESTENAVVRGRWEFRLIPSVSLAQAPFLTNRLPADLCYLAADEDHGARWRHEARLVDAMAFFFLRHDGADFVGNVFVACAAAQQEFQVVIFFAE